METSEIVFHDATSVECNTGSDFWGTPVYAGGEYESGCQECDEDLGCPTAAPTTSPTPFPTDSPTKSPTATPPTAPPTTEPPTPATGAAVGGLRGGGTDAPTTEDEGGDDGMSTHTRLGVIVGGVAVILALTFFAKMSKSRVDKRAQKDREFRRRHSSARLSGGVGELTANTANPMRSPGRSESSSANVEQAPSEPPTPGGDGGGGAEGDESPTPTNDTLELAAN